jgi:hypothetical protein
MTALMLTLANTTSLPDVQLIAIPMGMVSAILNKR